MLYLSCTIKNIVKKIILFFLIFLSFNLYSQNWNLINQILKYNYSLDTSSSYNTTILTDSIYTNNGDTTFYLNRIVTDCSTCQNTSQNNYLLYNQPTFLQRKVIKHNNIYNFCDTASFTIITNACIGSNWLFDTLHNVTAQIINVSTALVLGTNDSIKTIRLSTNDTIIISKNFGIVKFQSGSSQYSLIGVEGPSNIASTYINHGFVVPKFMDFFSFNVGDVFQYDELYMGYGMSYGGSERIYKVTILNKIIQNDSILYNVHINGQSWNIGSIGNPYGYSNFNYNSTILYIDTIGNLANALNNQLFVEPFDIGNGNGIMGHYTQAIVSTNNTGLIEKSCGFDIIYPYKAPFYEIDTNSINLLHSISFGVNSYLRTVKVGLGQTALDIGYFEGSYSKDLIGYVKNGDTAGTVYSDFQTNIKNSSSNKTVQLYPNPTTGLIKIGFSNFSYNSEKQILINDISGRKLKEIKTKENSLEVNISNFEKGVYYFVIKENNLFIETKIVINQ